MAKVTTLSRWSLRVRASLPLPTTKKGYYIMEVPKISFDIKNLNIHIEKSYIVKDKMLIRQFISNIVQSPEFSELKKAGFTRTEKSMYNEWVAHNVLHRFGYKREQTANVDIDQGETLLRRFCYWILSMF